MRLRAFALWVCAVGGCQGHPAPSDSAPTRGSAPVVASSSAPSLLLPAASPPTEARGLAEGAACSTAADATARCAPGLECFETDRTRKSGVCATFVSVSDVIRAEATRYVDHFIGLRDVTMQEYGEHCTPTLELAPKQCGSSLRINDESGYLFLKSITGSGYGCTFRKNGGVIEAKSCAPKPGRYEVVVGKLTRRETGWGKLEVAGYL